MQYKLKYLEYKLNYLELKNQIGSSAKSKELEAILEAQKFYEMKEQFKKNKKKLETWCHKDRISFKNYKIVKWFDTTVSIGKKQQIVPVYIPELIEINHSYEKDVNNYYNLYKYEGILSRGAFGIIIRYKSVYYDSYIVIKLLANKNINKIKGEIDITNTLSKSDCNVIETLIINSSDESFSDQKISIIEDNIYKRIISNELDNKSKEEIAILKQEFDKKQDSEVRFWESDSDYNYVRKNFFDQDFNKYLYYGMIIMPAAYDDISYFYKSINYGYKTYINFYLQILKSVTLQIKCLIEKHDKYYTDLKMQQILFWQCEDSSFNFILADLGGAFNFNKRYPVISYGPPGDITRNIKSQDLLLFGIAALWHKLFSIVEIEKKFDLYFKNIDYNSKFNFRKRKGPISTGPSDEFKENVTRYLAYPSYFLNKDTSVVYDEKETHIIILEKQREIMIKWLCADIYNPDGAIHTKESIISNLNYFLSTF